MENAGSARLVEELTFQDVSKRLGATSVLCMPIGSIEQHGPHLPLNTDVVLAEGITRRIVARWGETLDLWQLPAISISLAREHEWAPGTLSLSVIGMSTYMRDLARALTTSLPARNLMIVNGHGGNRGILEALAQEFRSDFGLNMCILHPASFADTHADAAAPEIHGGKNETSMMLAIAPYLVRRDAIPELKNPPQGDAIRQNILQRGVTWPWTSDDRRLADTGVIGDPEAATELLGQQIIDRAVAAAGDVIRQLLANQVRLRPSSTVGRKGF